MAYVITQKCLGERYATCVEACPVECIHPIELEGQPYMVIDPDVCINCAACLHVCPISAIVASEEEDPQSAQVNRDLTPIAIAYENLHGKVTPRPANDPPRRPDNTLT